MTIFHEIDHALLFFFNQELHTPLLDSVMQTVSGSALWIVVSAIAAAFALILRKRVVLESIVLAACSLGLSDLTCSFILKPFFARVRPCRALEEMMRILDSCSGVYSFPSNHASNAMAFAMVLLLCFPTRWMAMILVLPLMIGLSRIYLGVHYPTDVLAGFATGALIAWGVVAILRALIQKKWPNFAQGQRVVS